MTAAYRNEHGTSDVKVTLVTPEEEPLELFGPTATKAVRSLLEARGVIVRPSSLPAIVRGRTLLLAGGAEVYADRVIALPALAGPELPGSPTTSTAPFRSTLGRSPTSSMSSPRRRHGVPAEAGRSRGSAGRRRGGSDRGPAGAAVHPSRSGPSCADPAHGRRAALPARGRTVGRDATWRSKRRRAPAPRDASAAAGQALWWPPAKIVGRYLAPYLATARVAAQLGMLEDRVPVPGPRVSDEEMWTRSSSRSCLRLRRAFGHYPSALNTLDAAEALQGALPPSTKQSGASGALKIGSPIDSDEGGLR